MRIEFTGFSKEGLQFLSDIELNNNKTWFESNKHIYLEELLEPAKLFIDAVGDGISEFIPNIRFNNRTNGSGSLMRFYRDVRFSKD
jgi:uncharacterized protein (DUF2461 family)